MNRLYTLASVAFCIASAALIASASAQFQFPTEEVPTTEPEYIAKVKTAAPASVVNNATITMYQAGSAAKTLQTGNNGFTCFIGRDGTPECDDQNATEWRQALRAHKTPPYKIGLIYMLAGDTGVNNEGGSMLAGDTGANNEGGSQQHTHQHWVQTGPHVMIVGGAARDVLSPFPRDVDVKDPSQPYIMHPGKPNEHLMIPVHSQELTIGSTR